MTDRLHTREGISPFDGIACAERFSPKKGGKPGEGFRIIAPTAWSGTAVGIVVDKYRRKAGVPERRDAVDEAGVPSWLRRSQPTPGTRFLDGGENDVRMIVLRIVGGWTYAGWKHGYFHSEPAALAFHDELCRAILLQQLAPASPQWFNAGLWWAYGINGPAAGHWHTSQAYPGAEPCQDAYEFPQVHACLPYSERVHTTAGLLPIGEIVLRVKMGETMHAYDRHGEPTRIVAGVCNGRRTIQEYEFDDGSALRMTSSHVVFVLNDDGSLSEKQAGDLQAGDKLIRSRHFLRHSAISQEPAAVNGVILGERAAWLAGMMVGDGYSGRTPTMTTDTWELKINTQAELSYALDSLDSYGLSFTVKDFSWGWAVRGSGEGGKAFWERWGLWGNAHAKTVPEWAMRSPLPIQAEFLRGLFDSDGHCRKTNICLTNTSEDVIDKAQMMLAGLGIFSVKRDRDDERAEHERQRCYWLTVFDFRSIKKFAELVGFRHEEKAARLAVLTASGKEERKGDGTALVEKRRAGNGLVYDIQTEAGEFWCEGKLLHNCFLQGVEDTLIGERGISDLLDRESRVFKYGGGSGTNFSNLRGKGEPLSGGGTSSGLMSFLPTFDKNAGAIKSGGTTRRAAKMACLDADYPDIEEFATWKVREEDKVAAMDCGGGILNRHAAKIAEAVNAVGWTGAEAIAACRAAVADHVPAGFVDRVVRLATQSASSVSVQRTGLDYEGEGYSTVSGQNANNSVRLPDAFMRMAQAGRGEWPLFWRTEKAKAREEGRPPVPCRVIDAGQLWDSMTHAAWACADPGLHFSDTINDWNTCASDGRIEESNPCFAGDTRILTSEGYLRIDDLVGRGVCGDFVPVIRSDGTESVPSRLMVTGVNPILRVTLSDGREVKTTPNHNWILANGTRTEARRLKDGDRVKTASMFPVGMWAGTPALGIEVERLKGEMAVPSMPSMWSEGLGEILGHLIGDGCLTANGLTTFVYGTDPRERGEMADRHAVILESLFGLEPGRCDMGNGCRQTRFSRRSVGRFFAALGVRAVDSHEKTVPESVFTAPPGCVAAFLRGYFGADGSCSGREEAGECEVTAHSTSLELLRGVQRLLDLFGIQSSIAGDGRAGQATFRDYVRREGYRLRINPIHAESFRDRIGFSAPAKNERLASALEARNNCKAKPWPVVIASIVHEADELTFCLTEDRDNAVFANGVHIGQCAEYHFLSDTACNLASLRLTAFAGKTPGEFDWATFRHCCALLTTVLDLSIDMAGYPSKRMAERSGAYRTLGLGHCDVGALLMRWGVPYDSDEGRQIAAACTAFMHFACLAQSAELARTLGTFPRFAANKGHCDRVMENHYAATCDNEAFDGLATEPPRLAEGGRFHPMVAAAQGMAAEAMEDYQRHGLRNAQLTLLAPTGTIALEMDADTTGVEPDFALVKFKKLAGGGYYKIINRSVPVALEHLGYGEAERAAIVAHVSGHGRLEGCPHLPRALFLDKGWAEAEYVEASARVAGSFDLASALGGMEKAQALGLTPKEWSEAEAWACGHGTIEGAPHLKPEHLPVFDCANKCGKSGTRYLSWRAHVLMMGACQPFLSGAISKTINLPMEATPEDFAAMAFLSWEQGLKAIAGYRDGSKLNQPLAATWAEGATGAQAEGAKDGPGPAAAATPATGRRSLPSRRRGYIQKAKIGGHKFYLRTGEYPDGTLGEIFLDSHKEGAEYRAMMNCLAIAVSLGLQHGVPLEEFVDAFTYTRFDPSGPVQGHDRLKNATSVVDFIFRDLAIQYLGRDELAHVPKEAATVAVLPADVPAEPGLLAGLPGPRAEAKAVPTTGYEGTPCRECGAWTVTRRGTCLCCDSCGTTSGCQ